MTGCLGTVLWRDEAAQLTEYCAFRQAEEGLHLEGVVLAAVNETPLRITYRVACDREGLTRSAVVEVTGGPDARHIELAADAARVWRLDGRELPDCCGLADVDLGFSPSTNSLAIRRLRLAVGESRALAATWVRFPEFDVVVFPQRYTRLALDRYRFESGLDEFQAELIVDEQGIVRQYGGLWQAAAAGRDC
ncbi:MAG TPA: putative glycolipid-binding domain-containing protein [Anaerolineaceae bacterium]|nr:putative glycolipid-binding domain-containing protein [Anaerolineaceae bacterium]